MIISERGASLDRYLYNQILSLIYYNKRQPTDTGTIEGDQREAHLYRGTHD